MSSTCNASLCGMLIAANCQPAGTAPSLKVGLQKRLNLTPIPRTGKSSKALKINSREECCCTERRRGHSGHRSVQAASHPLPSRGVRGVETNGPARRIVSAKGAEGGAVLPATDSRWGVLMEDVVCGWGEGEEDEAAVLKRCSLAIPRGEFWMLLGPNGCGKSTLLKVLAGLLQPSSGKLRVLSSRSFVFQNPDHQVVMPTVCSDVAFGLGHLNLPESEVRRRVEAALAAVGMEEYMERAVATLSGGQKQRVAIAGALAEGSRMLLLDELTTFLDEGDQVAVLEAIRGVVGGPEGVTALWVTHRLEELAYADGGAYMEKGRVVVAGAVKDLRAHIAKKVGFWPASWRAPKP